MLKWDFGAFTNILQQFTETKGQNISLQNLSPYSLSIHQFRWEKRYNATSNFNSHKADENQQFGEVVKCETSRRVWSVSGLCGTCGTKTDSGRKDFSIVLLRQLTVLQLLQRWPATCLMWGISSSSSGVVPGLKPSSMFPGGLRWLTSVGFLLRLEHVLRDLYLGDCRCGSVSSTSSLFRSTSLFWRVGRKWSYTWRRSEVQLMVLHNIYRGIIEHVPT